MKALTCHGAQDIRYEGFPDTDLKADTDVLSRSTRRTPGPAYRLTDTKVENALKMVITP